MAQSSAVAETMVGLPLSDAEELAGRSGVKIIDHTGLSTVSADLDSRRIRVWLNDDGCVAEAVAG